MDGIILLAYQLDQIRGGVSDRPVFRCIALGQRDQFPEVFRLIYRIVTSDAVPGSQSGLLLERWFQNFAGLKHRGTSRC